MDIYDELLKNAISLKDVEKVDACDIDSFLSPVKIEDFNKKFSLPNQIKIASLDDLSDFFRFGKDTLVHKAEKDLWRIKEKNGQVIIERLFNPETKEPIRV